MHNDWIVLMQKLLGLAGDGVIGEITLASIAKRLRKGKKDKLLGDLGPWEDLPTGRKVVVVLQLEALAAEINVGQIDGYIGPMTIQAVDELSGVTFERPDELFPIEKDVEKYYGKPGENQTSVALPYTQLLAWDLRVEVNKFSCHELVHDSIQACYGRVLDHYGVDQIGRLRLNRFGGCLNVRKKRGGTSWSMHAWGIAIDTDPAQNQLRWKSDRAVMARPEYNEWWKIWEDEGWCSLGRERDFDWMHIQATL